MKCHFSPCGRYIRIASLEGQLEPISKSRRNAEQPPLKTALLLSTYSLCGRKTTKSPPTLIHRTKIFLGSEASKLSVSNLPYTLSWTPEELYFTCSADRLKVYRIRLFNNPDSLDETWAEHSVLTPTKTVFLPQTASQREVYYFPPAEGSTVARIIVGSDRSGQGAVDAQKNDVSACLPEKVIGLKRRLSPPVVCYLDEKEDLGGWGKSEGISNIPEDLGIGKLDQRRERFDPDDDCDRECSLFNSMGHSFFSSQWNYTFSSFWVVFFRLMTNLRNICVQARMSSCFAQPVVIDHVYCRGPSHRIFNSHISNG
jgi:hypothetical protein